MIVLKCRCTCWYCLCTREGHCGNAVCRQAVWKPEEHPLGTPNPDAWNRTNALEHREDPNHGNDL